MYKLNQLESMSISELLQVGEDLKINNMSTMGKKDIVYKILDTQAVATDSEGGKKGTSPILLHHNNLNTALRSREINPNSEYNKRKRYKHTNLNTKSNTDSKSPTQKKETESPSTDDDIQCKISDATPDIDTDSKSDLNQLPTLPLSEDSKLCTEPGLRTEQDAADKIQKQSISVLPPRVAQHDAPVTGLLEVALDGFGFLRLQKNNYFPSFNDVYVQPNHIRLHGLKTGDVVQGFMKPPKDAEKYYSLSKIDSVNGSQKGKVSNKIPFEKLVPIFPHEIINLANGPTQYSTRILSLFAPIGKGQRGLIVAPPKTGKTILLEEIACAIAQNHPEIELIALLICERPEEVTHMSRVVKGEVVASTFDEHPDRQVRLASIVLEKAKRLVESGKDVVILLDSLTRLARAYNAVTPASGKVLSGGVDVNALNKPKAFFGAARKVENAGSLTILATALVETGSKMDEVIFEEFKGTGNMELQLDRRLANKRIFPAIDIPSSSTRNENLLLDKDVLSVVWNMRKYMSDMTSVEAMEFLMNRMEKTSSNDEFIRYFAQNIEKR